MTREKSRQSAALDIICDHLPRDRRRVLERLSRSSFSFADTAACLLGEDLWYAPLAEYRDYLQASGHRPHLWNFEFGPSGAWCNERWNALSLTSRLARGRIGPLAHEHTWKIAPSTIDLSGKALRAALNEMQKAGLCAIQGGTCIASQIASPEDLRIDLYLVLIIEHWIRMLEHADAIARDKYATGYEVHGYDAACGICRARWGMRSRREEWVPPFHPGCRCFAQPRYASRGLAPI